MDGQRIADVGNQLHHTYASRDDNILSGLGLEKVIRGCNPNHIGLLPIVCLFAPVAK